MGFLSGVRELCRRVTATVVVYPLSILALRTGDWERARRRLLWVIENHPHHFGSHVQLGKLHLHLGNRSQALRLLNQARFIDPPRFERAEIPREIQMALGRDPMLSTHDLVVEPSPRAVSQRGQSHPAIPERSYGLTFETPDDEAFQYRDFSNMEEYVRFRSLPPISGQEIETVDWDELIDRINDDST